MADVSPGGMSWGPGPMSISAPGGRQAPSAPTSPPQPQSASPLTSALSQSHQQSSPVSPGGGSINLGRASKGWTSGLPCGPGPPHPSQGQSGQRQPAPALALSAAGKRAQGPPLGPAAHSGPGSCPLASQSEAPRPPVSHSPRLCRKPQWLPLSSWTGVRQAL